jgi:hypothetical protein
MGLTTNMNRKLTFSIVYKAVILAGILAFAAKAHSQTTTNTVPSLGDSLSSVASWAGNINTNLHYADVILWDGPVYENQVNVANELGGSYDLWRSDTNALTGNSLLFAGVETRNRQAGIAGSWLSEGFGGEFGWMKGDFRAGLFCDGVHLDNPGAVGATSHFAFEGGIFADKMLSSASAVGLFGSFQTGQKYPILGAHLVVTFGNGTGFLGLFKH